MTKYFLILFLIIPCSAHAENKWQLASDIASYGTVATSVALDFKHSLDCPDRKSCIIKQVARDGLTEIISEIIKRKFPADRPCAPNCGISNPKEDVPSGHTALAFSFQFNKGNASVMIPLGIVTAALRMGAGKHDLKGVLIGAGVGIGVSKLVN